jgi:hypothetical protein
MRFNNCSIRTLRLFFSTVNKRKVVLFPGNGIGPEISQSVQDIFSAAKIPIEF